MQVYNPPVSAGDNSVTIGTDGAVKAKLQLISIITANNTAEVVFTSLDADYAYYHLVAHNIRMGNDSVSLEAEIGDATGTYTTPAEYNTRTVTGSAVYNGKALDVIRFNPSAVLWGNGADEIGAIDLKLFNFGYTGRKAQVMGSALIARNDGSLYRSRICGMTNTSTKCRTFKIKPSAGNIAEGTFLLYGIRA